MDIRGVDELSVTHDSTSARGHLEHQFSNSLSSGNEFVGNGLVSQAVTPAH
jgi:hypothetical protein